MLCWQQPLLLWPVSGLVDQDLYWPISKDNIGLYWTNVWVVLSHIDLTVLTWMLHLVSWSVMSGMVSHIRHCHIGTVSVISQECFTEDSLKGLWPISQLCLHWSINPNFLNEFLLADIRPSRLRFARNWIVIFVRIEHNNCINPYPLLHKGQWYIYIR